MGLCGEHIPNSDFRTYKIYHPKQNPGGEGPQTPAAKSPLLVNFKKANIQVWCLYNFWSIMYAVQSDTVMSQDHDPAKYHHANVKLREDLCFLPHRFFGYSTQSRGYISSPRKVQMNVWHVHIILGRRKARGSVSCPVQLAQRDGVGIICTGMETAKSMHFRLTWQSTVTMHNLCTQSYIITQITYSRARATLQSAQAVS